MRGVLSAVILFFSSIGIATGNWMDAMLFSGIILAFLIYHYLVNEEQKIYIRWPFKIHVVPDEERKKDGTLVYHKRGMMETVWHIYVPDVGPSNQRVLNMWAQIHVASYELCGKADYPGPDLIKILCERFNVDYDHYMTVIAKIRDEIINQILLVMPLLTV